VFLCTIDCQKSNLVCSHNDNLACNPYMVLFISVVSGIVYVICLVIPAVACVLILSSLGAIIIAVIGFSVVQITECENTVSIYTLDGTNTRASGIWVCFPHLLMYRDFWSINSIL